MGKSLSLSLNFICHGEGSRPVDQSTSLASSVRTDRRGTDVSSVALAFNF
jgi:hypothetical protein